MHNRNATDSIKLIEVTKRRVVHFAEKGNIDYATLSYVCGPGYSLCVLSGSDGWAKDEEGNLYHPLPLRMPATLGDAMNVTQQLGLKYLWVDSICIAQDDEDEKQAQIARMYNIYSDASVCIISAGGLDSHTPLPGVSVARDALSHRSVKVKEGMNIGLPLSVLGNALAKYRYMARCWTYQELLLSQRLLFFTTDEVYFYCTEATYRESRVERGQSLEAETWASLAPESKSYLIGNAVTMRKTTDPAKLCGLFAAAAQEYSSRILSYQEDALGAFYGLLQLFTELSGANETVGGCPGSMLLNGLTWKDPRTNTPAQQIAKRRMCTKTPGTAVLPSWVWCSYDGPVKLRATPHCYEQSVCQIYQPLSEHTVPQSSLYGILHNHSCSIDSHSLPISNHIYLPVRSRTAILTVFADGDEQLMPGQADLSDSEGESLGPCDFRGQCTLNELHESEVTFLQLFFRRG